MTIKQRIKKEKIVSVIRHANESNILPIIESLHNGGITLIEITAETPNVDRILQAAITTDKDVIIGAGTVLDAETARYMILSGAQFIVTPTVNKDVIKLANRYGIFVVSGAFTPTEIITAYESGADMVKVFPAGDLGPNYIKNLLGPLGHIPVIVTGGISLENMTEYLNAGSYAVGIGSSLVNPKELTSNKDFEVLKRRAQEYSMKIQKD